MLVGVDTLFFERKDQMNVVRLLERLNTEDHRLDLDKLEVTDDDLALVAQVPVVSKLFLGQNPLITVNGLKQLVSLANTLEHLSLGEMMIDDDVLQVITTLFPNLKHFWFIGERVTVTMEGLRVLAQLQNLQTVMVDNEDYHAELCRLYPKMQVYI